MTREEMEKEAREHVDLYCDVEGGVLEPETRAWAERTYLAATEPRERELEALRAKLAEAKAAIRWMHGYDEPGTEDFPICPEGKRFAWRIVARQQFAIVREACSEPIPLPEPKP